MVLRPEHGASATVERARAMGLDALAMPLFEIVPLAWDVPDPGTFDALLLTSANAVRHGGDGLRQLRALPAHAVGEATAGAAREAGFDIATEGDGGVERLLNSVPVGLRLLHLCGEHRSAVPTNHAIVPVPVYRSVELAASGDLRRIEGAVVAVHSPRAGERLAELADQLRVDRTSVQIAAISEAAASAAGDGWAMCEAAASPDDAALLALAARLCDKAVTT
ncbi:MAG: uroporphyrinogen-III synthase [Sphingomicrobium sp.]